MDTYCYKDYISLKEHKILLTVHCFALFVCLTLLASFFLPSHLSFKNMYILNYFDTYLEHFYIFVCVCNK